MWIVELDHFCPTAFHFSDTLVCHVNKSRACHKKEAQVEFIQGSDHVWLWRWLMTLWWASLDSESLEVHNTWCQFRFSVYTVLRSPTSFPTSLSLLFHPSTQTPLFMTLWPENPAEHRLADVCCHAFCDWLKSLFTHGACRQGMVVFSWGSCFFTVLQL